MLNNSWFKKEKPFAGFGGFGGGATGLGVGGAGGPSEGISATGGIICDYESPTSPGTFYRCHVFNATGSLVVSDVFSLRWRTQI